MSFDPSTSGSYAVQLARALANNLWLWSTGRSAVIDPEAVTGTQRVDSGAAAEVHKINMDPDDTSVREVEVGSYQHGDLEHVVAADECGELKQWAFEQVGSDPTAHTDRIGQLQHRTDTRKVRIIRDATTLATLCEIQDDKYLSKELPMESWTLGGTPPAAATKGTTPAVPALRFTTTSQTISRVVRVPREYLGTADLKLRLYFCLNQAEATGDDINISVNLESRAAGEAFAGTSTLATGTVDMGSSPPDAKIAVLDVTLDFDDATNPIAPSDFLALEVFLTNTTTIADVLFLGAELLYPGNGITE